MHFNCISTLFIARDGDSKKSSWNWCRRRFFFLDSIFKVLCVYVWVLFLQCATIISCDLLAFKCSLSTNLFILSFCGVNFSPKIIQTKLYIKRVASNLSNMLRFLLLPFSCMEIILLVFRCPWTGPIFFNSKFYITKSFLCCLFFPLQSLKPL